MPAGGFQGEYRAEAEGVSTIKLLITEYGTSEIPLAAICERYMGLCERVAKDRAAQHALPIPAYRTAPKAPWHVRALVPPAVEGLGLFVYDHARPLDADADGVAGRAVAALAGLDGSHAGATRRCVARDVALGHGVRWRRMAKAGESGKRDVLGNAGRTDT